MPEQVSRRTNRISDALLFDVHMEGIQHDPDIVCLWLKLAHGLHKSASLGSRIKDVIFKAVQAFQAQRCYAEVSRNPAHFGNARDARNIFEDMVVRQANRLSEAESPDKDALMQITKADFLPEPEESAAADPDGEQE